MQMQMLEINVLQPITPVVSFTDLKIYDRAHAPGFASGKVYSPFSLDVWQLDRSVEGFKPSRVRFLPPTKFWGKWLTLIPLG
ncbi:hypothetical protein CVT25_005189 [Psilocybe cyanescens]|uniref:Uncharacterized protein n=1 Tax=Psilocybe cyanescens TaxID=93625 RepID=A0A409XBW6_PSICY|nr:hypothetical protein CVT25_005189 [Psilocybe cyanescens]